MCFSFYCKEKSDVRTVYIYTKVAIKHLQNSTVKGVQFNAFLAKKMRTTYIRELLLSECDVLC